MLLAFVLLVGRASPQSTMRPKYMDHAVIQHNGSSSKVIANDPIPLHQVLTAIREEYGWRINWEAAPCYSRFEVVDDTAPSWRIDHPNERGVTRPAGALFTATFTEPPEPSASSEAVVLTKIVEDYNASENPGKYA